MAAEQRRLLAELMSGERDISLLPEVEDGPAEADAPNVRFVFVFSFNFGFVQNYLVLILSSFRCESPENIGQTREFDFDSIYGNVDGGRGGSDTNEEARLEAAGWGPPMANLMITGLPPNKEVRSTVKSLLRAALNQVCGGGDRVNGLTWGSKWGTCFVGMKSALDASTAIVQLHEKPLVLKGIGTRTIKIRLDADQGLKPPPIPDSFGRGDEDDNAGEGGVDENGCAGGRAAAARERKAIIEADGVVPMSFTSRQGRIEEGKEVARERRWRQETRCWCSICGSSKHAHKVTQNVFRSEGDL
jgi:hypothetical protein